MATISFILTTFMSDLSVKLWGEIWRSQSLSRLVGTVDEVIRVIYFAHTARELWKSETLWKKLYEITTTAQCLIVIF